MRIEKKKLYEEIADTLSTEVQSGMLKEGEKLPSIQSLAKQYGVGAAAIREALNALRVMGLVTIKHGEGTFVKAAMPRVFTPEMSAARKKDIIDLLEVRKIIEVGAVKLAAAQHDESQLQKIRTALEQMLEAVHQDGLGEQSDLAFHMAIASASNNHLLMKLLNDVSDVMKTTMKETRRIWLYKETKTIEKLYYEHLEIYEAIQKRDSQLAEQAMYRHLEEVEKVLIEHLNVD